MRLHEVRGRPSLLDLWRNFANNSDYHAVSRIHLWRFSPTQSSCVIRSILKRHRTHSTSSNAVPDYWGQRRIHAQRRHHPVWHVVRGPAGRKPCGHSGQQVHHGPPRFRSRVSCPTRSAPPPCAAVMSSSMVRVVRVRPADRGPWLHSRSTAQNCQDSRSVSRASSNPLMLTRYFSVSSGGSSPEASRQLT
jgi:hypothetical protein